MLSPNIELKIETGSSENKSTEVSHLVPHEKSDILLKSIPSKKFKKRRKKKAKNQTSVIQGSPGQAKTPREVRILVEKRQQTLEIIKKDVSLPEKKCQLTLGID